MTHALIRHVAGGRVAARVAEILTYQPRREGTGVDHLPTGVVEPAIREAVAIMQATLSQPLPIAQIAERCAVPGWRMSRLFKKYMHRTPQSYYVGLRLQRLKRLP